LFSFALSLSPSRCFFFKKIGARSTQADPTDSHSWLALALVEARRGRTPDARAVFEQGTQACPASVHLWQV